MTAALYPEGHWRKPVGRTRTELSAPQELFLDWLTDEEGGNVLGTETQASFGARSGISPTSLSKWKRDPLFVRAWESRLAKSNVSPDKIQRLLEKTYELASGNGDDARPADQIKAIELYMKMVDRMTPDRHTISVERAPSELSDEELALELETRARALRSNVIELTSGT